METPDETLTYERLVIATGSRPSELPNVDAAVEVHYLRSLEDARRLTTAAQHARTAVVIGPGFIGCEAAASLATRGIATTLLTPEAGPQENRLGDWVATQITAWLTQLGVTVRPGVSVTHVTAPHTVHCDDGTTHSPDLILAAVGIEDAANSFTSAGLQLHEGRVVVDEHLNASENVWAAGDSALGLNVAAGRSLSVEHWGDALAMGELAGANAAGSDTPQAWDAVPGFWSEIGEFTLKYAAWGDGYADAEVVERTGGFTVWYADESGTLVGVLTYNADDDYERGEALIAAGATAAEAAGGLQPPSDDETTA